MESSRYLCAIKVLYTGRATFEIKGGDRTSVPGEAKTVNSLRPSSSLLLFSLFRIVPWHSASFIYERSDRFTYNDRWQETATMEEQSLGKTSRWGRTNDRLHLGSLPLDSLWQLLQLVYFLYMYINIYIYKYKYIFILWYFFRIFDTVTAKK